MNGICPRPPSTRGPLSFRFASSAKAIWRALDSWSGRRWPCSRSGFLGSSGWHPQPASPPPGGPPLAVAVAAADDLHLLDHAVLDLHVHLLGADPLGFVLNGQGFPPPFLGQYKFSLSYQRFQKNARDHSPWKPCVSLPRLFCKKRAIVSLRAVSQRAHPVDQPSATPLRALHWFTREVIVCKTPKPVPAPAGQPASSGRCSCWPLR